MEEARTDGAGSWLGAVRRRPYVRSKHPLAPHSCPQTVYNGADNIDGAPRSRCDHEVSGGLIERVDASGDGSNSQGLHATHWRIFAAPSACRLDSRSSGRLVLRRGWFDRLGARPVPLGGRCPQRPLSAARSLTDAGAADTSLCRCQPLKMWEFSREQAHFPAEQPASQPHPWLPSADADPRRSRDPRCPPAQGSRRAVGLIESFHRRRCCRDSTGCAARRTSGG